MRVDVPGRGSHTPSMAGKVSALVFLGFAATAAVGAQAGGPVRGGAVVVTGGGGAVFGRPIVGVFPTAPAAIAPSFRNATFARTRFFGPPLVAGVGVGVPMYVGPPAYYDPAAALPQVAYAVPVAAAAPPAPPPPPERQVIEYPDGRYELRGDGVSAPYRWVWVPNPPAPPRAAQPAVRLYAWTDEQGVLHVTDRLDRIPARHRAEAQRNASS